VADIILRHGKDWLSDDVAIKDIGNFVDNKVRPRGAWASDSTHVQALAVHVQKNIVMMYEGKCVSILTTKDGKQRFLPWETLQALSRQSSSILQDAIFIRHNGSLGEVGDHFEYLHIKNKTASVRSATSLAHLGLTQHTRRFLPKTKSSQKGAPLHIACMD
jgi:hypothetical protein